MSARTSFFICGRCGFRNQPRMARPHPPDPPPEPVDNSKCEQCGESRDHEEARDYNP